MSEKVIPTDACAYGLIEIVKQFYAKHPELLDAKQNRTENNVILSNGGTNNEN